MPSRVWAIVAGAGLMSVLLLSGVFFTLGDKKSEVKRKFTSEYQQERDNALEFAKTLTPGDCFQYTGFRKSRHTFEKTYTFKDHVHVVVARDEMGLLIAQPHPECKSSLDSTKCDYWFRTVPFDQLYLITDEDVKIPCPTGLTRKDMIKRLNADPEYNVKYKVTE